MQQDIDTITAIAREAGTVALSYFRSDRMEAREKGERDVVTAADIAAERLIVDRIRKAFPRDGIVAEEGSEAVSQGGRVWYIDPLDGTLNYSRGIPIWCVSIGLFEDGKPALGVIHDPTRDETFTATAGDGAWRGGARLRCSNVTNPADAFVHLTVDFKDPHLLVGLDDLRLLAPIVLRTRNIGSAALALAYVAAGQLDAMIHRSASTWDYCAGIALVQEAGGVVTSMSGEPYVEGEESMLAAATPELHEAILAHLEGNPAPRLE